MMKPIISLNWPDRRIRARLSRKSCDGSLPEDARSCSMRYCAWISAPTSTNPFSLKEIFAAFAVPAANRHSTPRHDFQDCELIRPLSTWMLPKGTPVAPAQTVTNFFGPAVGKSRSRSFLGPAQALARRGSALGVCLGNGALRTVTSPPVHQTRNVREFHGNRHLAATVASPNRHGPEARSKRRRRHPASPGERATCRRQLRAEGIEPTTYGLRVHCSAN